MAGAAWYVAATKIDALAGLAPQHCRVSDSMWDEVNGLVTRQLDLAQRYFVAYHSDLLAHVSLTDTALDTAAAVYTMSAVELAAQFLVISNEIGDNITGLPMDVLRLVSSVLRGADRLAEVTLQLVISACNFVNGGSQQLIGFTCTLQVFRVLRATRTAVLATAKPVLDRESRKRLIAALKPMLGGHWSIRGILHASRFPDCLEKVLAALPAGRDAHIVQVKAQVSDRSLVALRFPRWASKHQAAGLSCPCR